MYLDDDSVMKTIEIDSIFTEVMVKKKKKKNHFKDVLHVRKLQANLLSVSKLLSNGLKVQFNLNNYIMRSLDGDVIVMRQHCDGLYKKKLYQGAWSGYGQFGTIMKEKQCI